LTLNTTKFTSLPESTIIESKMRSYVVKSTFHCSEAVQLESVKLEDVTPYMNTF